MNIERFFVTLTLQGFRGATHRPCQGPSGQLCATGEYSYLEVKQYPYYLFCREYRFQALGQWGLRSIHDWPMRLIGPMVALLDLAIWSVHLSGTLRAYFYRGHTPE